MGRRPVKNKKMPEDYPQLAFRVSKVDKAQILGQLSDIQTKLNSDRSKDSPFINKNDLIINALNIGLKHVKKYGI